MDPDQTALVLHCLQEQYDPALRCLNKKLLKYLDRRQKQTTFEWYVYAHSMKAFCLPSLYMILNDCCQNLHPRTLGSVPSHF